MGKRVNIPKNLKTGVGWVFLGTKRTRIHVFIIEPISTYHYCATLEGDIDFVDQRHATFFALMVARRDTTSIFD